MRLAGKSRRLGGESPKEGAKSPSTRVQVSETSAPTRVNVNCESRKGLDRVAKRSDRSRRRLRLMSPEGDDRASLTRKCPLKTSQVRFARVRPKSTSTRLEPFFDFN